MATLVYRYGLLEPLDSELAMRHLRAAHRYRNMLVEIEHGRRAAMRDAEAEDPVFFGVNAAIAWLDAQSKQLGAEAKRARSSTRTRAIAADLREQLKQSRLLVKRAKLGRSLYRALWMRPQLQLRRDAINNVATDLRRNLRRHRCFWTGEQLYHGTYTHVEDADAAARKAPLWDGAEPNDPHFTRFTGEGALGVQIQGGAGFDDVVQKHPQLRISRSLQQPRCNLGRGTHKRCSAERCCKVTAVHGRGRRQRWVLWMRQESDTNRDPVWVQWPMQLHRPLPPGARIMRVNVHRRTLEGDKGQRAQWYAVFTLRVHDAPRRNDGLAVAVDVGWRLLQDGSMRVAYWRGEDGRHDQLVLTKRQLAGFGVADGIRAARDRVLEQLRAGLCGWLDDASPLPDWMTEARRWMPQWRSPKRFYRLIEIWQRSAELITTSPESGRPDATAVLAWLQAWRRRDQHLAGYEAGQRDGQKRHRQDYYRRFSAWLSECYDVVVLERFDKRQTNRTKQTEDGAQTEDVELHYAQRLANTSGLCQALKSRFGQLGQWVEKPAAGTTLRCAEPECDGTLVGDAADHIMQQCSRGHTWDQDHNACRNLLTLHRERSDDDETTGSARAAKSETRWARAKRMRAEKDARLEAARKAKDDAAE